MSVRLVVTYDGMTSREDDYRIRRLARKREEGSGFGFGIRDISFVYRKADDANAAATRLRRAGFIVTKGDA